MGQTILANKNRLLQLLLSLIFVFGLYSNAIAQQRSLGVSGVVKAEKGKLSGASINIYKGSSRVQQFTTDGSGKFDYPLEVDNIYIIEISKPGYVSKKLSFNTTVPAEENLNWTFDFVVELFKVPDGVDLAVFKNPVAKVQYNEQYNDFDYDLDYSMEFQKKEDEVLKEVAKAEESSSSQAEAQAIAEKRQQEQAAKDEAAKQAETDKAYKAAIADGDKEFKADNMDAAFNAYTKASELNPAESYPKVQIEAVNKKMEEKRKTDIKYYTTLDKGDDELKKDKFAEAIAIYQEASKIKVDNKEALERIKDAEAKQAASQKKEEEYKKNLAEADKLFGAGDYEKAKLAYNAALGIKPNEKYPAEQVKLADAKMAEEKKAGQEYEAFIQKGDKAFAAANYDEAVKAYQAAQALKPAEKYPSEQIAAAGKMQEEARKQNDVFAKFMESGNKAMADENYAAAKVSYEQALKVKKDSEEALKKLQEVEMKLAALNQQEEAYKTAIANGDQEFKSGNFDEAKKAYEKALSVKAGEAYPKEQLASIANKQAEAKKQEEANKAYAEAVAIGDKAFGAAKYDEAASAYKSASALKPAEKYPNEQLKKIEDLLKESKKVDEGFANAMEKGAKALKDERYAEAKSAYEEALKLKKDDGEALKKLQEVEMKLAALAMQEKEYGDLIASADKAFKDNQLENAKAGYEKALGIKPNEKYPKEQLAAIATKLAEQQKQQGQEKAYADAIAKGDAAFGSGNYDAAGDAYKTAQGIKPNEKYPSEQLKKIEDLALAAKKADEEFDKAMAFGDKSADEAKYKDAKIAYEAALKIKKDNADALKKLQAVEVKLASKEQLEQDYKNAIEIGDAALKAGNYETAKTAFEKAAGLKPDEKYPKEQLAAIEAKFDELRKKENQDQAYTDAIAKADKAFAENSYEAAVDQYKNALGIKPKEKYPTEQLDKIDRLLKDTKEQDKDFEKAIEKGDKAFKDEKYADAKAAFEQALGIKKDSPDALKKLQETEARLAALAQKDADYKKLISQADDLYNMQKYAAAKTSYEVALKAQPEDKYAKQRIDEIKELLAKNSEIEKNYKAAIESADASFGKKDFTEAKAGYEAALKIKPTEAYPKGKIDEINGMVAEKSANDKAYDSAIAAADNSFKKQEYSSAKAGYQQALVLKPGEQYPSDRIKEIDGIVAQKAQLDKDYADLIRFGDNSFNKKDWKSAIENYNKALTLKADEQYPKDKIKETEEKMKGLNEKDKEYLAVVADADKAFKTNKFSEARDTYNKALSIKPGEQYPKDQIAEIDRVYDQLKQAAKKKEAEEADRLAREEAAKKQAEADAQMEAEMQKRKEAAIEEAKLKALADAEAEAKAQAENSEVKADLAQEEEEKRAEEMQKNAQRLLEKQIAEEEAKIRAEAERKIRAELEGKLSEEKTKILEEQAEERALEAQEKRKVELETRKKAEEEAFAAAQEKAKALEAQEKAAQEELANQRKAEEEAKAQAAKEKAEAEKQLRIQQEEEAKLAKQQKEEEEKAKAQAELEARKQAEKEAFVLAQEKAKAIQEKEKAEREEAEAARKAEEEAKALAAKEKAAQEEEMRKKTEEEIRLVRQQKDEEERARVQAELEARKQAEKEAFEKAQAEAKARLEAEKAAKEEKEAQEKAEREAKIEAAKLKAEADKIAQEEEDIRKKAEAAALVEAAKAKKASEEQARLEEEERRKEYVQNRAEEAKSKVEFEKTAKEIALQTAKEEEAGIYDEVKAKLEAEYADDFAALEKLKADGSANKTPKAESEDFHSFKSELAKKYPLGITEETLSEPGKNITKLVVNRQGNANEYQKVKWNWGGVYYFKNGESISKAIYDTETKW